MKRIVLALITALAPAWSMSQILIGQTAGFSGPVAAGVKETIDGARLWIDHVNAKGGVHGQKIEILSMDDKFDPKLSLDNAKVLIEQKKVIALFLSRGTPHTEGLVPLLDAHAVALVAPSTGAMTLHQPVKKHVFNVRSSYQREAEKTVTHLYTTGVARIAVVHVDDSFGVDAFEGASKGFTKAGFQPVMVVKVDRLKPDYKNFISQIIAKEPQAVLWLGPGNTVTDGVKALRALRSNVQVVTLSNNASGGFVESLGEHAPGVIVSQVLPSERSYAYAFVKEAMQLAKQKGMALSPAMLEGFLASKVLVEGLRRAGPNPTRGKLVAALEGIRKFDVGGLEITYGPDDHTGLEFADLSIIGADGKFRR